MTATSDLIQKLYIGYFGRAGDPEGLQYWVNRSAAGMSDAAIAQSFSVQPEATAMYGFLAAPSLGLGQDAFLEAVYQNLFERSIETGGLNYWKGQLASGRPVGGIILDIINGAVGADATTVANKLSVANYYTEAVMDANAHWTLADDQADAIAVIANVTSTASTVTTGQALADSLVAADTATSGGVGAVSDSNAASDTVAENAAVGTVVGVTASAIDPTSTDTVTYSLSTNPGNLFAIDATTGVVTVNGALDYEAASSRTITVKATSSDGSATTRDFTIAVTDVAESVGAVSDGNSAPDSVAENAVIGTVVGITASAADPQSGDTVSYSLTSNAGGRFAIDAATGVVTVNGALDYEAATSHSITVKATSSDGSSSTADFTIVVSDVADGQTYVLTHGVDSGAAYTGTTDNDTFNAFDAVDGLGAVTTTWTALDSLVGGLGNDTFRVQTAAAVALPAGATVSGIESAEIVSNAGIVLGTTAWSGLTSLTTQGTTATLTAATSTNVNATQTGVTSITGGNAVTASVVGAGLTIANAVGALSATVSSQGGVANAISVNGGSSVTVVASGNTGGTITVGNSSATTGAISVTNSGDYTDGAAVVMGAITLTGGSSVTVTQTSGITAAEANAALTDATNGSVTQSAVTVTGTDATTSVSVSQSRAQSVVVGGAAPNNIGQIAVVNGTVTITDVNAATATADRISTVTLANYGNSTIESGALATLNLSGTAGTLGINATVDGANQTATTLALNLNGLSRTNSITLGSLSTNSSYTTVNLESSTAASTLANLAKGAGTAQVSALNISGDAALTLGNQTALTATAAIASTNTSGVTLTTALAAGQSFTGGDGVDVITLAAGQTGNVNMGGGNDTVTVSTLGAAVTVDAGDGTADVLSMTAAAAATASLTATFEARISNFERLSIGQVLGGATNTINMANLDDINHVISAGTAAAVVGVNGFVSRTFSAGTTSALNGSTITFEGVTVTLGTNATASDVVTDAVTLFQASALTGWTISGNGGTLIFTKVNGSTPLLPITFVAGGADTLTSNTMSWLQGTDSSAAGILNVTNMASGGTLELTDAINGASGVAVTDAATGTADVLNIRLNGATNIVNTAALTVANVETINIEATDSTAVGNPAAAATILLNAANATTLTVTGNHGVDFTGSTLTNVTRLDASGVTGTGANAAAAAIAGAVTFSSVVTASDVIVTTNNGNDVINVSSITDVTKTATVSAGEGNNAITAGVVSNTITVGAGDDLVTLLGVGTGANTITLGDGANTVTGATANGDNTVTGGTGIDTITLGNGDNEIDVGAGNNVITVGTGDNTITVGAGDDLVTLLGVGTGANTITLGDGANTVAGLTADGDNTVTGGAGIDTITLGNGNNTINAGDGADIITLGTGTNTLTLGAGADVVNLGIPTSGGAYSTITDFAVGDQINFAGAFAAGTLGAQITLGQAAGFTDYLNAAAAGAGTSLAWFQFGGNTFVVADDNALSTFTNGADSVVALTGLVTLTGSTYDALGVLTFV